jgi:hypothetical protein
LPALTIIINKRSKIVVMIINTGADVVWLDELAPLLAHCLGMLAGRDTLVLLAHQVISSGGHIIL